MKFVIISLVMLLSACCTSANNENYISSKEDNAALELLSKEDLTHLDKAVALAKQNKDYRLLVTSGRSLSIPGIKASDYNAVIDLCGKKYNSAVGDVISSEEQRLARKKQINFMRKYNEVILVICQASNKN